MSKTRIHCTVTKRQSFCPSDSTDCLQSHWLQMNWSFCQVESKYTWLDCSLSYTWHLNLCIRHQFICFMRGFHMKTKISNNCLVDFSSDLSFFLAKLSLAFVCNLFPALSQVDVSHERKFLLMQVNNSWLEARDLSCCHYLLFFHSPLIEAHVFSLLASTRVIANVIASARVNPKVMHLLLRCKRETCSFIQLIHLHSFRFSSLVHFLSPSLSSLSLVPDVCVISILSLYLLVFCCCTFTRWINGSIHSNKDGETKTAVRVRERKKERKHL